MLAHRLRRWPNINPTLVQRLVFAGYGLGEPFQCWIDFSRQNLTSKVDPRTESVTHL